MSPRGLSWVTHPHSVRRQVLCWPRFPLPTKQGLSFSNPSQAYHSLLSLSSHPTRGCPHSVCSASRGIPVSQAPLPPLPSLPRTQPRVFPGWREALLGCPRSPFTPNQRLRLNTSPPSKLRSAEFLSELMGTPPKNSESHPPTFRSSGPSFLLLLTRSRLYDRMPRS